MLFLITLAVNKTQFISGDVEVTYLILRNYPNINYQQKMGLTPLMCAAEANGGKVVKLLLEFKAEKDITDKKGWTALMYAACSGSLLSLEALLKLV